MRPMFKMLFVPMAALLLVMADSGFSAKNAPVVVKRTQTTAPQTAQPQTPAAKPQTPAPQPQTPATQPTENSGATNTIDVSTPALDSPEPVNVQKDPRAGEQINWQVIASGGSVQTLGTLVLGSTIGQVAAGTSTVGSLTLQSGFWQNFTTNYLCGDLDGSGDIDIADAVFLVNYIFSGGAAPNPMAAGDTDCDGEITIADAVVLVNYIFAGGAVPCAACK